LKEYNLLSFDTSSKYSYSMHSEKFIKEIYGKDEFKVNSDFISKSDRNLLLSLKREDESFYKTVGTLKEKYTKKLQEKYKFSKSKESLNKQLQD
jgi:hypothetical protein